jgi:hypothetical protein
MDVDRWEYLALALALFPLFTYVMAVCVVKAKSRSLKVEQKPVFVNPSANPFPTEIAEHFDRVQRELQAEGFEPVADYALPDTVPNGVGFARMFVNWSQQEVASATAVCLKRPVTGWQLRQAAFHFSTNFADGTGITTTNNAGPRMLPPPRAVQGFRFTTIHDVSRLRRIHQAIVNQFSQGRVKEFVFETRFSGDPLRYHVWTVERTYEDWQKRGYWHRDKRTGELRLTFKGCLVAALYLLPPIKRLAARQRRQASARLLRQLNI